MCSSAFGAIALFSNLHPGALHHLAPGKKVPVVTLCCILLVSCAVVDVKIGRKKIIFE